ncbi:uncharacterized protein SCHCODRAFT_02670856 [Schizophyllum commune H4-8]|uniref:Uncharacterized protein n=1 Tax=Schizophyllum commune (strain H4-8 / FGSC 9210) TaxID=578458 RepID=D8QEP8_SCHCM|nr:uncharacterized protein SCHCODRAFT_02670856 [Schizophyllum commune H4-8]KAI5888192.1 hypothetical protein SCHCODRAFT_02670856 [Schizophyllum commune H4-8]
MHPTAALFTSVRNEMRCPISGSTENLWACPLIPYEIADDEDEAIRMEWVFGLPRGGLWYYLRSKENVIHLRKDIRDMYRRGDFVLVPTFRECARALEYLKNPSIKSRDECDRTPRRPLSALARPDGLFRYVFIPVSKAGWDLRRQFDLQPQTKEDLNGGILPDDGKPMLPGTEEFPVIECLVHPFSVASFADETLNRVRSTLLSGQYHALVFLIIDEWERPTNNYAPQWFIDEPTYDCDDTTLSATEATGYNPLPPDSDACTPRRPASILQDASIDEEDDLKKVCHWFSQYDPKAKPPREASRSPAKVRRSRRLQEKMGVTPPPSPGESEPPLSPVRRGPLRPRDPVRCPPAWARRNGRYPTHRFTSNDWAYFRYHVAIASHLEPPPKPTPLRRRSARSRTT